VTPGDLYRTCRTSAFRLEVLQHYIVSDDKARQTAFHEGKPLPPPRQSKVDDLRLISDLRQTGREIGRVHVVTWPLSDYVRYELAVYAENVAAGEDVRIADGTGSPELAQLTTDFAIFDAETDDPHVILFDYTSAGELLRYEYTQAEAVVERCRQQRRLALESSVALSEFTAIHEQALAR
jgi:hypothetical protein